MLITLEMNMEDIVSGPGVPDWVEIFKSDSPVRMGIIWNNLLQGCPHPLRMTMIPCEDGQSGQDRKPTIKEVVDSTLGVEAPSPYRKDKDQSPGSYDSQTGAQYDPIDD